MEQLVILLMVLAMGGLLAFGRRTGPPAPEPPSPPRRRPATKAAPEPPPLLEPDPTEKEPVENAWRLKPTASVLAEKGRLAPAAPAPEPQEEEEEEPGSQERRQFERLPTNDQIAVTPFAGKQQLAEGLDVSLGGMRFRLVGDPPRQSDLLRLSFNVKDETVEAVGRVVRVKTLDPVSHEVAVEFARIDPWAMQLLERALSEMGA